MKNLNNKSSGILLHITSLNGKYGIGTLGQEAYQFIDYLAKAKQQYWQILPTNPVGYGESPYQCFSAFAQNHLLIDLEQLVSDSLITFQDLETIKKTKSESKIDFKTVINTKIPILKKAALKFDSNLEKFKKFQHTNNEWLSDYCLFMALKEANDNKSWLEWPMELKNPTENLKKELIKKHQSDYEFHLFCQFIFANQWEKLKNYANQKGIKVIGDMPIYVSVDSSDVWANKHLFVLDDKFNPAFVAGVPPDYFSTTGQLWGNPHYNWNNHLNENFTWWVKRFESNLALYDMIRIDHFIGFINYYAIPYGALTAEKGEKLKAPGQKLFETLASSINLEQIIAEDLGLLTEEVINLRDQFNLPGMKLLQFAYDDNDQNSNEINNWPVNSVGYIGTHDNNTLLGWIKTANYNELKNVSQDLNLDFKVFNNLEDLNNKKLIFDAYLKRLMKTNCFLTIITMQDLLLADENARINTPGTLSDKNWSYKLSSNNYQATVDYLASVTKQTQRFNK